MSFKHRLNTKWNGENKSSWDQPSSDADWHTITSINEKFVVILSMQCRIYICNELKICWSNEWEKFNNCRHKKIDFLVKLRHVDLLWWNTFHFHDSFHFRNSCYVKLYHKREKKGKPYPLPHLNSKTSFLFQHFLFLSFFPDESGQGRTFKTFSFDRIFINFFSSAIVKLEKLTVTKKYSIWVLDVFPKNF